MLFTIVLCLYSLIQAKPVSYIQSSYHKPILLGVCRGVPGSLLPGVNIGFLQNTRGINVAIIKCML